MNKNEGFQELNIIKFKFKITQRFHYRHTWHPSFKNNNIKIIILFDLMLELYLRIEKHLESLPFLCIFYKNLYDH